MALIQKSFSDLITFTRASGGGRFNAQGVYEWLAADQPRLDYDPVTGECLGLLVEGQRTRLNLISAAPTAPQTVTVGASAQTISFFGSGSVDLTGAHTATLLGSGPFPARRTYTFTPSAGSLTITPTGDVRMLQVEAGAFATSPIVGEGAQVTRAADIASVNELSPWYRQDEGTLFVEAVNQASTVQRAFCTVDDGTLDNRIELGLNTVNNGRLQVVVGGVSVVDINGIGKPIARGGVGRMSVAFAAGHIIAALNGTLSAQTAIVSIPAVTKLVIGGRSRLSTYFNGHIRSIRYYPRRLSDTELTALTA